MVACLAALVAAWNGCGASEATNQKARGAEKAGFLDRLFPSRVEPMYIPAGTIVALRLDRGLSSHQTPVGASFTAEVTQEVSVGGRVAIPIGSTVHGRVTDARRAEKIGGRASLSVAFDSIEIPNGETIKISARLAKVGKSERAKDAAIISGSTIGGAILGDAVDNTGGGTVGALVGGIAGTVGALKTKGKPVELAAGATVQIELEREAVVEGGS
jgi:hypothetical protein